MLSAVSAIATVERPKKYVTAKPSALTTRATVTIRTARRFLERTMPGTLLATDGLPLARLASSARSRPCWDDVRPRSRPSSRRILPLSAAEHPGIDTKSRQRASLAERQDRSSSKGDNQHL